MGLRVEGWGWITAGKLARARGAEQCDTLARLYAQLQRLEHLDVGPRGVLEVAPLEEKLAARPAVRRGLGGRYRARRVIGVDVGGGGEGREAAALGLGGHLGLAALEQREDLVRGRAGVRVRGRAGVRVRGRAGVRARGRAGVRIRVRAGG